MRTSRGAPGVSRYWTSALQTSARLCGGMFVAIPTAIPLDPLRRRFGTFAGRTTGSSSDSSKFEVNATVSFSMSCRSSSASGVSRTSV